MVKIWLLGLNMIKILSPEVQNNQNFASGGEKQSYYFEKCCRKGPSQKKCIRVPRTLKPPLAVHMAQCQHVSLRSEGQVFDSPSCEKFLP